MAGRGSCGVMKQYLACHATNPPPPRCRGGREFSRYSIDGGTGELTEPALAPASTGRTIPVTQRASSEAR